MIPYPKTFQSPGRLLMIGFRPEEENEVLSLVAEGRLGGLILFGRNGETAAEVLRLAKALFEAARQQAVHPPIIAVDQEQGPVCRIRRGVTLFPGPSFLGSLGRTETTASVAHWVAREMAALGMHLNFAPVADVVAIAPPPAVLLGRAFGSDPDLVAGHVGAWIRGSQRAKIAACAKHFPGHGSVAADSHRQLPFDRSSLDFLQRNHLPPFTAAIQADVAAIMVGHVAYEALHPGVPASLSNRVIKGLLRNALGFRNLTITDDLEMEATAGKSSLESLVLQALAAGEDMALVGRNLRADAPSPTELVRELETAARRGKLDRDRLQEALRRVQRFSERWIPRHWQPPTRPRPPARARRLAEQLWALAVPDKTGRSLHSEY
jgi:beta-N-acetylhexosaminidase